MDYKLTAHARQRMRERNISIELIEKAISNPTKISVDNKGVLVLKKTVLIKDKQRLLIIAGEIIENKFKIFTVIDTSKIKKYL